MASGIFSAYPDLNGGGIHRYTTYPDGVTEPDDDVSEQMRAHNDRAREHQNAQARAYTSTAAVDSISEDTVLGGTLPSGIDRAFTTYMDEMKRRDKTGKRKHAGNVAGRRPRKRSCLQFNDITDENNEDACVCCKREGVNKQLLDKMIIQAVGSTNFFDAIGNATEAYNTEVESYNRPDAFITRGDVNHHAFGCLKDPRVTYAEQITLYKYIIRQQVAALQIGKTQSNTNMFDSQIQKDMRANTKMLTDLYKAQLEKLMFYRADIPSVGSGNTAASNKHALQKGTTLRPTLY